MEEMYGSAGTDTEVYDLKKIRTADDTAKTYNIMLVM